MGADARSGRGGDLLPIGLRRLRRQCGEHASTEKEHVAIGGALLLLVIYNTLTAGGSRSQHTLT
jgi:hypothetical protein